MHDDRPGECSAAPAGPRCRDPNRAAAAGSSAGRWNVILLGSLWRRAGGWSGLRTAGANSACRATAPNCALSGRLDSGAMCWMLGVAAGDRDRGHGDEGGGEEYEDAGLDALEWPVPAGGLVGDQHAVSVSSQAGTELERTLED